jgi:hypothetical protein
VTFQRGIDGGEPIREPVGGVAGVHEERHVARGRLASGTLACPRCDAPVALAGRRASPAEALHCPYCRHSGAVRDFLSLAEPTRPARVVVRVLSPARRPASRAPRP